MSRSRLTEITMKYLALVMMIGLLGACGAKSDDTTDNTTETAPTGGAETSNTKEAPATKDTPPAAARRTIQLDISGMT